MQDYSKRERLIEELKENQSIRLTISQGDIDRIKSNTHIENEEEYWLLAEHLKYLRSQKKEAKNSDRTDVLNEQMHNVEEYLLEAQFGDRNISRFNEAIL